MTENANILTTPSVTPSRHQVVALAYDGLCTFEFGVAVEIFGLPRPEMGDNWYQFAVAAVDEGPLCATGGIRLMTDGGPELLAQADTIVVPGWRGVVARRLVVSPHRDGGQAQQVLRPVARSRESLRLGQLFDYLHQHLAASHTVASLAQRAGMGTRTFLRRFEEATGKTPARWLLEERLLRARQHLTESMMGIDQIAERCGFASAGTLRHHFRQHFALSPLQYRKQFTPSPIAKSSQPRTIDGHSKPVARRVDDEERVSGSDL